MDFSVETWACIDVIKTCHNIDLELKHAQNMFKQVRGNVKHSTVLDRQKYFWLLKKFDLSSRKSIEEISFFDILDKAIENKFLRLSEHLAHRHIIRDRIHENGNRFLLKAIRSKNNELSQYLLTLPKVKKALASQNNEVFVTAVKKNMIGVVNELFSLDGVRDKVHENDNKALFESMTHPDLVIFQQLIAIPKVKENFAQIMPKICEFLSLELLAKSKEHVGLVKFDEQEIIDYAIEVSRAGHVLGLSDKYLPSDIKFPMTFSGSYSTKSLNWVLDHLTVYFKKLPHSGFKKKIGIILSIFKDCDYFRKEMFDGRFNEKPFHTAHKDLFNRFLLNKMIYLLSGWDGHAVGIVLYKVNSQNIFIGEVNRGEFGEKNAGTKIYKVTNAYALIAEWIRKIQKTKTHEEYVDLLKLVTNLDKPMFTLPQKSQKYPNCGYANKIAAIEPMLFLLRAKFSGEILQVGGLQKIFDRYKRDDYKKITYAFREQETNRLVSMIKSNRFCVKLMYDLVRSIILQHPGRTDRVLRPEKFEAECQRARRLLRALPDFYQNKFRKMHSEFYDLIDYQSVITPSRKWILTSYNNKKGVQSRTPTPSLSTQMQSSCINKIGF